jgi:hypothetical protein
MLLTVASQDMLLSTLISLFSSLPMQSTYFLRLPLACANWFPYSEQTSQTQGLVEDAPSISPDGQSMLTATLRPSQQLITKASSVQSDVAPHQMASCAVVCAPLSAKWKAGLMWPNVSSSEFSLSMWLLVESNFETEARLRGQPSRRLSSASTTDHEFLYGIVLCLILLIALARNVDK